MRKCARPNLIGMFTLLSLCLISAELMVFGEHIRNGTLIKKNPPQFSSGLSGNWSNSVWRGMPQLEIVKEHKGTMFMLRRYQSHVALFNTKQNIQDEQ